MIDRDRVFALFILFSGLDTDNAVKLRCLCDNAAASLSGRLRPGLDIGVNMERICAAAAVMASCDALSLGSTLAQSDEIRVGDVTLRPGGFAGNLRRNLEELRDSFLGDIADLLQAPFVFGQIPNPEADSGSRS